MDEKDLYNKFYKGQPGEEAFLEMYQERQKHKDALRERLKKYHLSENELDELFKIVTKAEFQIEELKSKQKFKETYTKEELDKFGFKILDIQMKMKNDFESRLSKIIKKKFELADEILKKQNEQKEQMMQEALDDIGEYGIDENDDSPFSNF